MSSASGRGEIHLISSICGSCSVHFPPRAGIPYISNATSLYSFPCSAIPGQLLMMCYCRGLKPGGWIEQMEFDVRVKSDDGTLKPDSHLAGWGDNFIGCGERAGHPLTTQETMRGSIEKAGFIDVHEFIYKVPMGPWPKNKVLKEAGQLNFHHWSSGLEGYAMWLLTKYGAPEPWTTEEVQVYLANVRAELKSISLHAYGLA